MFLSTKNDSFYEHLKKLMEINGINLKKINGIATNVTGVTTDFCVMARRVIS